MRHRARRGVTVERWASGDPEMGTNPDAGLPSPRFPEPLLSPLRPGWWAVLGEIGRLERGLAEPPGGGGRCGMRAAPGRGCLPSPRASLQGRWDSGASPSWPGGRAGGGGRATSCPLCPTSPPSLLPRSLDLTGPLLLGGVPDLPESFPVQTRHFVGCMRNLQVDSRHVDMADFIANNGTVPGMGAWGQSRGRGSAWWGSQSPSSHRHRTPSQVPFSPFQAALPRRMCVTAALARMGAPA